MKNVNWILMLAMAIGLLTIVGCAQQSKNSARMVELDQSGQIMPGVPAIEGGCVVEAGDNVFIKKLVFKDGNCVVEMGALDSTTADNPE